MLQWWHHKGVERERETVRERERERERDCQFHSGAFWSVPLPSSLPPPFYAAIMQCIIFYNVLTSHTVAKTTQSLTYLLLIVMFVWHVSRASLGWNIVTSTCGLICLHTVQHLHTTMRPPPITPHITTHSPLTERHIWITPFIVTRQYQRVAIILRSRQLLKMGTWLPEICWATCKREIKNNTKVTSSWFLIHTELRCTVNHTSVCSSVCKVFKLWRCEQNRGVRPDYTSSLLTQGPLRVLKLKPWIMNLN